MAAIAVDRTAGVTAGLDLVPPALASLRRRQLELAGGLAPEQWAGPSRCHRWTVHQVLRHVRDVCHLHVTGLQGDPIWLFDEPFDARATPDVWLAWSEGEAPEQTLTDLRRWSAGEAPALLARLAAGGQDAMAGPFGPVPWTVLSMHVLWDGWLHDRDVSQVTGGGRASTPAEEAAVAAYGLFIASMAAVLVGAPLDVTVSLSSDDRSYVAAVAPGHVELETVDTLAPADLHGQLDQVVDSLSGRGALLAEVLDGDPATREPLTWLGARLAPASTA